MTASGLGALGAAVALVIGGRPRPVRIAGGAIVLGIASVALAVSTSFPLSLALMVPIGAGGITMAATANATIQLSVPDGLRGRVMSVYTTVFAGSVPIGGIAAGCARVGRRRSRRRWRSAASCRWPSGPAPTSGGAGSARRHRRRSASRASAPAAVELVTESATAQSTAPSTSAAFRPPKPNEVLSTRR